MPDFGSQDYWDNRFQRDDKPFDWLLPASALRDITRDFVEDSALKNAQILHIGCGTSDSSVLHELVQIPEQIHNVDFSEAAVDAGARREQELLKERQEQDLLETGDSKHDSVQQSLPPQAMRWSCLNMLSLESTKALLQLQAEANSLYDVVLDKSTCDSISCAPEADLNLPYPLSINGWTRRISRSGTHQAGQVHPLHVLAVHLAALTTPSTGRWIAISYSEDRFPFIPPFPHSASTGLLSDDVIKAGFPHPHQLWRLEAKEKIGLDTNREETLAERKKRLSAGYVHQPRVSHWLYVLRRTDALVTD